MHTFGFLGLLWVLLPHSHPSARPHPTTRRPLHSKASSHHELLFVSFVYLWCPWYHAGELAATSMHYFCLEVWKARYITSAIDHMCRHILFTSTGVHPVMLSWKIAFTKSQYHFGSRLAQVSFSCLPFVRCMDRLVAAKDDLIRNQQRVFDPPLPPHVSFRANRGLISTGVRIGYFLVSGVCFFGLWIAFFCDLEFCSMPPPGPRFGHRCWSLFI